MSKDTIYRQAAIDALDGVSWMHLEGKHEICDGDWIKADEAEEALKQLPSAHSEERTNERTETHACDLISRQKAIDANDAAFWETKNKKHYTKLKMLQSHAFLVETALKDLPSAQPDVPDRNVGDISRMRPEIVRCKNCKWYKTNYSWNGKEHKVCVIEPYEPIREGDDFCSRAERKE